MFTVTYLGFAGERRHMTLVADSADHALAISVRMLPSDAVVIGIKPLR